MDFVLQLTGFSFFSPLRNGSFLQTVKVKKLFVSISDLKFIKLIQSESRSLKKERNQWVKRHQKLHLVLINKSINCVKM